MEFANQFWPNPLEMENGVIFDETPGPLAALTLADLPYVCQLMVHANFAFCRGANLQFAHIDGSVSIYPSRRFLSREDGLHQMLRTHASDN
ncbi:hypothetical protein BG000_007114, partial [Podila horticola]